MTKAEFIRAIVADSHMLPAHVEQMLAAQARAVSKALGEGDGVTIPGIARLTTRERAARKGRHPGTGEVIDIPAKMVVQVKVAKALADHVAG